MSEENHDLAFKKLYLEFFPKLLTFATTYTKDRQEAEIITDDVFLKLWANRSNLSAIKNFRFYLFVSTKNACLNYLKKNGKFSFSSIEDCEIDILGIAQSPEQKKISDERLLQIKDAINELPPKCKIIFVLVKENGLKYNEVAELLNISVKTVETQMSLAFKKISNTLGNHFPELNHILKLRYKA